MTLNFKIKKARAKYPGLLSVINYESILFGIFIYRQKLNYPAPVTQKTPQSSKATSRQLSVIFVFMFSILPGLIGIWGSACAQTGKQVSYKGVVVSQAHEPLENTYISIVGQQTGTHSNASGVFDLEIPAQVPVRVQFKAPGYVTIEKVVFRDQVSESLDTVMLTQAKSSLEDVTVTADKKREEAGLIAVDANQARVNPSAVGGIEGLLKTFVGSNNELTSQYAVRGGNYDENLVYVNGFEIYRPFLVSSGQQEGLSFINADLTENVRFYTGGFQAKYGDKLSSVLDVAYQNPERGGGSAYLSLLEQGLSLKGISDNKKFSYLIGLRNKTNRNVVKSQATTGNYIPSSADLQGLFVYRFSPKFRMELLGDYNKTKFLFYPEQTKLTASVFSPYYVANYGVNIDFEGSEKDKYSTGFAGLTAVVNPNDHTELKFMASYYQDKEKQEQDITGAYEFGERDENGNIIDDPDNLLGVGVNQSYARNNLRIQVMSLQHQGSLKQGVHFIQWGAALQRQEIDSRINQWNYSDSAGYSLPVGGDQLQLSQYMRSRDQFAIQRISGYLQDNLRLGHKSDYTLQYGVRANYNDLNQELLISPRAGFSFKPGGWKRDVIFKASAGMYQQPAFYREMVTLDGSLNKAIKAQKSMQGVIGLDYQMQLFNRPARITSELYYKHLYDVIPYDIDNVRIQYYGQNNAKAYVFGWESRLFTQFVKGADSWLSLGVMQAREKIDGLSYQNYYNQLGELITAASEDKVATDSTTQSVGWLRRPSDRLITFGMFFQDYLSTNKNVKVYLNTIYGTNLPFNIPGSTRYRNALEIPAYLRMDIGFSALLLDGSKQRKKHAPFKGVKDIWASFEIFNLINRDNTISYMLLKDFNNDTYALPNRLTPRLVNFKIAVDW
ncbi:TonB-dependent Receptor Plug Domain [Arachidicoccus rhizosphaerae]|uniref:TonB-dependent Receptor Plug Domain n=1 Tax=Arachidicoccus rhizosphaerae TaxID=551991 RepID=A0A1H3XTP2_9BACT|nr:TonB-dependent Receptor Plug Domain [Arachidicoccus rhizosphaerae]